MRCYYAVSKVPPTPQELDTLHLFEDLTLADLAGKVEHKDDWEAFIVTLDRWRDR